MTQSRKVNFLFIALITLFLTACASHYQDATIYDPYGFFAGFWHGLIVPISFFGWLFLDGVYVVGTPNTGGTYIIGFIIGVMTWLSNTK